ncbi:MAG: hypothetical protein ACREC4_07675, partial [Methylocella sp.]
MKRYYPESLLRETLLSCPVATRAPSIVGTRNSGESLGAVVAQIPFSPQIAWQLAAIGRKYHHDL